MHSLVSLIAEQLPPDTSESSIVQLPYGPAAFGSILLIVGFLASIAYSAWRQGKDFVTPTRDFLAIMISLAFIYMIGYIILVKGKVPDGADILLGSLISAFAAIVALYFRSNGKE